MRGNACDEVFRQGTVLKDRRHDESRLEAADTSVEISRPAVAIKHRSPYLNVMFSAIDRREQACSCKLCRHSVHSAPQQARFCRVPRVQGPFSGIVSHQEALVSSRLPMTAVILDCNEIFAAEHGGDIEITLGETIQCL
jgi:hypothetical protein